MSLHQRALAPHVWACCIDRHVILLDLRRNKYIGLNADDASALGRYIDGWPLQSSANPALNDEPCDMQVLNELQEAGMLTSQHAAGLAHAMSFSAPDAALIDGYSTPRTQVNPLVVMRFLLAALRAKLLLRFKSLEAVVEQFRRRRARAADAAASFEIERVRALVHAYSRLRTFFFTADNHCLFDSLALADFLSRYGIFPIWVFGVDAQPFAAHCWLQHGPVVINDAPDHVRQYTPIMTV